MMTMHHESRLVGILSHHVDDVILAGDESDPLYLSALETVGGLYDRCSWEANTLEVYGCRTQQKSDGSIVVDQTEHACHSNHPNNSTPTTNIIMQCVPVMNIIKSSRMARSTDHDGSHVSSLINRCF